uniref:Uncharacterized protein n=1 Tax=Setaria viridis TaxID=4556 RepID=A0A4V6D2H8_SETVI|nr:hypothetical protein SEVIR_9G580050v2 [Setaria viridis]
MFIPFFLPLILLRFLSVTTHQQEIFIFYSSYIWI